MEKGREVIDGVREGESEGARERGRGGWRKEGRELSEGVSERVRE